MSIRRHIEARLGPFVERGELAALPSPWQLRVGWLAMLPVTLSESERERRASRRTLMGQVPLRVPLQLLYNPRQIVVDTGIDQRADQVVRHLLSVYHEDAFLGYDLQLLSSHPGGLSLLAEQADAVARGRSRWSVYLTHLVGGPGYHQGLVRWAEAGMRGELPDPLDLDPRFATLVGFARFCLDLPDWPGAGFYGFDFSSWRRG